MLCYACCTLHSFILADCVSFASKHLLAFTKNIHTLHTSPLLRRQHKITLGESSSSSRRTFAANYIRCRCVANGRDSNMLAHNRQRGGGAGAGRALMKLTLHNDRRRSSASRSQCCCCCCPGSYLNTHTQSRQINGILHILSVVAVLRNCGVFRIVQKHARTCRRGRRLRTREDDSSK